MLVGIISRQESFFCFLKIDKAKRKYGKGGQDIHITIITTSYVHEQVRFLNHLAS